MRSAGERSNKTSNHRDDDYTFMMNHDDDRRNNERQAIVLVLFTRVQISMPHMPDAEELAGVRGSNRIASECH